MASDTRSLFFKKSEEREREGDREGEREWTLIELSGSIPGLVNTRYEK